MYGEHTEAGPGDLGLHTGTTGRSAWQLSLPQDGQGSVRSRQAGAGRSPPLSQADPHPSSMPVTPGDWVTLSSQAPECVDTMVMEDQDNGRDTEVGREGNGTQGHQNGGGQRLERPGGRVGREEIGEARWGGEGGERGKGGGGRGEGRREDCGADERAGERRQTLKPKCPQTWEL